MYDNMFESPKAYQKYLDKVAPNEWTVVGDRFLVHSSNQRKLIKVRHNKCGTTFIRDAYNLKYQIKHHKSHICCGSARVSNVSAEEADPYKNKYKSVEHFQQYLDSIMPEREWTILSIYRDKSNNKCGTFLHKCGDKINYKLSLFDRKIKTGCLKCRNKFSDKEIIAAQNIIEFANKAIEESKKPEPKRPEIFQMIVDKYGLKTGDAFVTNGYVFYIDDNSISLIDDTDENDIKARSRAWSEVANMMFTSADLNVKKVYSPQDKEEYYYLIFKDGGLAVQSKICHFDKTDYSNIMNINAFKTKESASKYILQGIKEVA